MRWLVGAALVLGLAGCGGSKRSLPPVPMHCTGSGAPTIVLEAGLGQTQETWDRIRGDFPKLGRVCTYDRPGLGTTPRLPEDVARTVSDQATSLRDAV